MSRVWVEMELESYPIRIFRNQRLAIQSGKHIQHMDRAEAIDSIRNRIWWRTNGDCEWCGFPITEASMHLHEVKSRGDGGEISLENSVGICVECHITGPDAAHSNRRPRFKGISDV